MESLQARINSFLKSKRIKKNSKSNSTSTTVKWPHPASFNANPNTLAEAGFYWVPSWEDRDSVACFLCSKELSDWNEEDDPFQIHWEKCGGSCAWAMVRCGLNQDTADDGSFVFSNKARLPTSKMMQDARHRTFGANLWPHDTDDDHSASSMKMAQAGFVYTPSTKGDDTVTCLYCKISLSGWDRDDDPMLEHEKRAIKSGDQCPFFSVSSSKVSRSKKTSTEISAPLKSRARKTRAMSRTRSKQVDISSNLNNSSDSGDELARLEVVEEVRAPKSRGKGRIASMSRPAKATATAKNPSSIPTKPTRAKTSKSALARSFKSALANSSEAESVTSEVEADGTALETEKLMVEANADVPGLEDTPIQQTSQDDLIHDGQQPSDGDSDDIGATPRPPSRPKILAENMLMIVDETSQVRDHSPPSQPSLPLPLGPPELLAILPVLHPERLPPEDRCLTVEQWIRREIEISYNQLRQDGRNQISLFEGRAREVRQIIEAL